MKEKEVKKVIYMNIDYKCIYVGRTNQLDSRDKRLKSTDNNRSFSS